MEEQNENRESQDRVLFLDGIRGWASLMVLFSHLVVYFLANSVPGLKNWLFGFMSDGNFAVFIFFVLSGFALSTGFISTGKSTGITSMALRRLPRLAIPILFSSLAAYLLLKGNLYFNGVAGNMTGNTWTSSFYNFNSSLWGTFKFSFYDVFFHHNPNATFNPALWTMGIELWGSFFVFAFCALFMQLRSRVLILAFLAGFFYIERNFLYLPFLSGILIALIHHNHGLKLDRHFRNLSPILLVLVVYYSASTMRGGLFGLPPMPRGDLLNILAASVLLLCTTCTRWLRGFFENRLSRYLGSISFPLYLTHFMVLCSFSSYLMVKLQHLGWSREWQSGVVFLASTVACLLVAHVFRHAETFAIHASKLFSDAVTGRIRLTVTRSNLPTRIEPLPSAMPGS